MQLLHGTPPKHQARLNGPQDQPGEKPCDVLLSMLACELEGTDDFHTVADDHGGG